MVLLLNLVWGSTFKSCLGWCSATYVLFRSLWLVVCISFEINFGYHVLLDLLTESEVKILHI